MRYEQYSDIDFINDEFFVEWVLHKDAEADFFWRTWIANHPEKSGELNVARGFIESVHYQRTPQMKGSEFSHIHENILRFKDLQDAGRSSWRITLSFLKIGIAASLIIGILSLIFISRIQDRETLATMPELIIKEVPDGRKITTVLPDGTKVKINSRSNLTYPQLFGDVDRRVLLDGEAFFEVEKNPEKPFVISCSGVTVKVLGTSFNVKAYKNDRYQKIAVVSGKVSVGTSEGEEIVLYPDSMAVIDNRTGSVTTKGFNKKEELGWCEGILYFNKTPFHEVFKKLELWFGVTFYIEKGVSFDVNELYTGEFIRNESLENVLKGIGYTSGFDYKIINKQVHIVNKQKIKE